MVWFGYGCCDYWFIPIEQGTSVLGVFRSGWDPLQGGEEWKYTPGEKGGKEKKSKKPKKQRNKETKKQ